MRVAVEVLVPLRLFVCRFLSQHRINLLLALGAVAHLNLNFSKKFRLEVHIMAYNKARAEKQWLKWKEAEERKLRELGVDEETIQRLHTYDWAEFNRERRYLQRQGEWSPYVDLVSAQDLELPVEDVESLMDSIEDMELLRILSKEDKLTIQIAFLKMSGYNGYEIAEKTGLTQKAVNLRMVRLRKKLKKFFEA